MAHLVTVKSSVVVFWDSETGSEWDVTGLAVDGPLTGLRLEPIPDAYVAFWFAWSEFYHLTDLWVIGAPE